MNGQARYIPVESPFRLNCHYIKFPLTCFLDAAKRFGFREIELFGAMPHFFLDDVDGLLVEQVICECQKRGLKLSSFCPAQGAYPMNIAIDEEPIRRRTVRMLKKALRIAGKMGCETMLVSPGFGYHNQSREISWAHSRRSLEELADTAQENNREAARMIREVNSPFLKSMMDIGVMNYMDESVDEYFQNLGSDLRHIHFTDGPGAHVALGDGSFPMARYLEEIRRNGYTGILSFEINDAWLKDNGLSG